MSHTCTLVHRSICHNEQRLPAGQSLIKEKSAVGGISYRKEPRVKHLKNFLKIASLIIDFCAQLSWLVCLDRTGFTMAVCYSYKVLF